MAEEPKSIDVQDAWRDWQESPLHKPDDSQPDPWKDWQPPQPGQRLQVDLRE